MSIWRQLARGVRALMNRSAADREVADEVDHYLQEATDSLIASGLSAEEARRAARLELGNTTAVREEVRASGWENVFDVLVADVRCGTRRLRAHPGFATVSVLTLAVGVGASTAIFSAINPILFQPLPYPQASRVVTIWDAGHDGSRLDVTFGTFRELVDRSRTVEYLSVWKVWQPTMTGPTEPERLVGQRVTSDYFRVLGIPPAIGRNFQSSEDRVNGPPVVILSDGLWRRRFAGDRDIVGRQIALDGRNVTVAGVMPPTFENVPSPAAEIWMPLQYDSSLPAQGREWGHHLRMVGRLKPDSDHRRGSAGARRDREGARPVVRSCAMGRLAARVSCELAAGRRHEGCEAGARCRNRRGASLAGDRLRERHQPAAGARRAAARESSRCARRWAPGASGSSVSSSPRACSSRSSAEPSAFCLPTWASRCWWR